MGRLAELVGRGRAMEIVLGGNDFPAQLAAEYGYINRVLLDGELDDFVDAFARRIASFDKAAISGTKEFVDAATAIPASDYAASVAAFLRTAGRPATADRVRSLFARGFQQPEGIELDLGTRISETA
jgi:enoyl-CoA hydratase/carnithine racemase